MTDTSRGIFWMSASVLVFIVNDALIKLAAETAPALQVIGLRGIFATLWCLLVLLATGGWRQMRSVAHPAVFARGLLEGLAALTYLVALSHIPFAVATAVNLSTPFFLTILAVVMLKEDVRWRRWTAIVLGFLGVLLVIQPEPGQLNTWSWVVVASSLIGALRDVLGRYVPAHVPTTIMSFWSAAAVALMGLTFAAFEGWHPMSTRGLLLLVAASLLLAAGYQFLMLALRSSAEMSVLGSLRYGSVLGAIAIGYFVWGDVPNEVALAGIVVIIVSGLYILKRQSARGTRSPDCPTSNLREGSSHRLDQGPKARVERPSCSDQLRVVERRSLHSAALWSRRRCARYPSSRPRAEGPRGETFVQRSAAYGG